MNEPTIRVDDLGTILELTVIENGHAKDISAATTLSFVIVRPDQTVITRTAEFSTTGIDGKIQYLSVAGDFSIEGLYTMQAAITLPGWSGHTSFSSFRAISNLLKR